MSANQLDLNASRARFGRAATSYADASVVQLEVGRRLLERFDLLRLVPQRIVDAGCGPGTHTAALAARFPSATILAVDHVAAMVQRAVPVAARASGGSWIGRLLARAGEQPATPRIEGVVADLGRLPLAREGADVLWSNFALQFVDDLPALFADWSRVLKVGGVVMFTAPGPDTLFELRRAINLAGDDAARRVRQFTDLHDIGDMLVHAGFADPVMDMELITLEYATAGALWRDLRAMGMTNTLAARPRGLMTPRRLAAIAAGLDAGRRDGGPIRISVEVVYGHAWKVAAKKTADGHGIVRIDDIRRGPRAG